MPDTIFYQGADGSYHDAHGRAVDEDGTLLGAPDPGNLSAQGAEDAATDAVASDPAPAQKAAGKPAAKKAKQK